MSERGAENPLRREVVTHLRSMAERGPVLPTDSRHGALHALSLETLEYLLEGGKIPGSSFAYNQYLAGDISIFPTKFLALPPSVSSPAVHERLLRPDDTRFHAVIHAQSIGEMHGLLSLLKLPIGNQKNMSAAGHIFPFPGDDTLKRFFSRKTHKKITEIEDMIAEAEERKGFIIGISPTIQEQAGITLVPGDGGEGDIAIRTFGAGLGYQWITGIEACGPKERIFLQKLFGELE